MRHTVQLSAPKLHAGGVGVTLLPSGFRVKLKSNRKVEKHLGSSQDRGGPSRSRSVATLPCSEPLFEFKKAAQDDEMISVLVHGWFPARSSLEKMVHCGHRDSDMVSNKTQTSCGLSVSGWD